MRVRVAPQTSANDVKEYPSLGAAAKALGMTITTLRKKYNIERVYHQGHWAQVSLDYLKQVGIRHKDIGYCLIE